MHTQYKPRILFILKKRPPGNYGTWSYSLGESLPSGLTVSVTQMVKGLTTLGFENKMVQVVDNNDIDREVHQYKPTHVVIEAFWVVPEKFEVLKKLHPNVIWVIRNHSKTDFLSHEGGMIGWAIDYLNQGLILACNSPEATSDFQKLAAVSGSNPENVVYLPNYYPSSARKFSILKILFWKLLRFFGFNGKLPKSRTEGSINIGCFGAIRPLKNHIHQAIAAILLANKLGLKLNFWINGNRVEGKAESILTALRQLFKRYPQHSLVELEWMKHDAFTALVGDMDLVMQVSNSETFNIVSADAVASGVPVVVSDEVPWLNEEYHADPNSIRDIFRTTHRVWTGSGNGMLQADQLLQLNDYGNESLEIWEDFLK